MFCVHLVIDQPQTGTSGVVRQGRRHGPSITHKITPCWVTLLLPARRAAVLGRRVRPPCWASPLAFGLIGSKHQLLRKQKTLLAPSTANRKKHPSARHEECVKMLKRCGRYNSGCIYTGHVYWTAYILYMTRRIGL
jgi:hypothetical protein